MNTIFDNCLGQNKNNTVLKLEAWQKKMGFFVQVNFTADRLFNSLKHMYCKKNMFVLEVMEALGASDCETIMSTVPKDFFKYDKLFKDLY